MLTWLATGCPDKTLILGMSVRYFGMRSAPVNQEWAMEAEAGVLA